MVNLIELSEENWMDFARLSVDESQKTFLASNIGIIARGYVYRNSRAKVIGIVSDGTPVGLAMVRDMDDEPACYELQQFMIDKKFQGQGYGFRALELILAALKAEQKYACVEVCVKREDVQAIRVYEKAGFVDSGYIDDTVPDCLNFVYRLVADNGKTDAVCIRIVRVEEAAEKQTISRSILEALPEWFGIPEAREQYIKESAAQLFFCGLSCGKTDRFSLPERDRKRNRRTLCDGRIKRPAQKRRRAKTVRAGKESGKKQRLLIYASEDGTNGSLCCV